MDCVALIRYIKKNSFHFGSINFKNTGMFNETGLFYENYTNLPFVGGDHCVNLKTYGERAIIRDSIKRSRRFLVFF